MSTATIKTELLHSAIPPCNFAKCEADTAQADQARAEHEAMQQRLDHSGRQCGENGKASLFHPSHEARDREMEALTITAELCLGFGIRDHLDVRRIHEQVLLKLEQLSKETARERIFGLLELGDD